MDELSRELGTMLTTKHLPQALRRGAWANECGADAGDDHPTELNSQSVDTSGTSGGTGLSRIDSKTGQPKLMSWASEMSMYDGSGSGQSPAKGLDSQLKMPGKLNKLALQNQVSRTPPPPGELHPIAKMPVEMQRETANTAMHGQEADPPGLNKKQGSSGKSTRRGRQSRKSGKKEPVFDSQNLIINYLPPDMDSHRLRQLFSPHGNIINCKVVMDHSTGLSKGYGFVKFQQREQAEAAIKNLNGHKIGSKTLKVSTARKTSRKGGETGPTNLYIANLDKDIESSDLERYFSKVGYIVQCRVLKDEKGVTRRIGFVRYDNNDSALKAIKEFDGKKLDGKGSVIQVRFANTPRAPPGSQQYASPRIAPTSPLVDAVLLTPVARVGGGEEHVILSPVQAPALTEDGRLQTVYTFPTAAEENLTSPAMVPVSPTAGPYGSPRQSRVFGVGGNTTLLPPSELLQPREDSLPKYALKPIPRKGRPMLIPTESTPVGHEVAPTPPSVMVQSSPPPMVPEDAALPEAAAATGSSGRAAPTALPMQQVVYQVGGQQFQQVGTVGSPRTAQTVFITSPTSPGSTVISPATFAAQSPTTGQVMQVVRPLTLLNAQGGGRGEDQVQYVAVQSPHGVAGGVNAVTLTPVTIAAPDPTNTRNSQYSRSTACYVGGIEVDLQEADLKAAFEFDGIVVKSVRIIRRRVGPYAFVNFFNTRDAHKAAEKLNQSKLGNSQLTVRLK